MTLADYPTSIAWLGAGSYYMGFVFLVNIFIQLVLLRHRLHDGLCAIVGPDGSADLANLRQRNAHDIRYVDAPTGRSLMPRICLRNASSAEGGYQREDGYQMEPVTFPSVRSRSRASAAHVVHAQALFHRRQSVPVLRAGCILG